MEKNIIVNKAFMDAEGFLFAANSLKAAISKNGLLLGIYGPAYTANLSFACELYFKQLLMLENNKQRGHKLEELFDSLSENHKKIISTEYAKRCNEFSEIHNVIMNPLEKCLENYNTAFEDWRYWYEGKKNSNVLGWYDLHILIEIIREMVSSFEE